ncbi:hypothetical protein EVG20_g10043 [Dentipellis fragilis]|uniref:Uncharacterized protein n=1 Tax=Dentipellis fragilis TaxID=205917 RepID=A0A4Y9XW67_9AGAM|nr:hypothetical protein EVG20_g10043 [Dentipellis fragilis]
MHSSGMCTPPPSAVSRMHLSYHCRLLLTRPIAAIFRVQLPQCGHPIVAVLCLVHVSLSLPLTRMTMRRRLLHADASARLLLLRVPNWGCPPSCTYPTTAISRTHDQPLPSSITDTPHHRRLLCADASPLPPHLDIHPPP